MVVDGTGRDAYASCMAICLIVCAPHVRARVRARPPRALAAVTCAIPTPAQVATLAGWHDVLRRVAVRSRGSHAAVELVVDVLPFCVACLWGRMLQLYLLLVLPALDSLARLGSHLRVGLTCDEEVLRLRELNAARSPVLTRLRASVAMQTVFCILAVDFDAFPSSHAKSFTYGRSLMDLGVGATVLVGALTRRRRARHGEAATDSSAADSSAADSSAADARARVLVRHLPLVLLGLARLAAVRATAYPVEESECGAHWILGAIQLDPDPVPDPDQESEYGVHWNFFFTLAVVAWASKLLEAASASADTVRALLVLLLHQAALLAFGPRPPPTPPPPPGRAPRFRHRRCHRSAAHRPGLPLTLTLTLT